MAESAELKHERFVGFLKQIGTPWGIQENVDVGTPQFGEEFTGTVNITKFLTNGVKMIIFYRYRNRLDDHHSSDDRIFIEFNSKKIDYEFLINIVFPHYVIAFGAYSANIFNEMLIYKDFERSRNKNGRKSIVRIYPVVFYDSQFCKEVFRMNVKEILKKLSGQVYKALLHNNGIIIVADIKPLSVEESDEFDRKIRTILKYNA